MAGGNSVRRAALCHCSGKLAASTPPKRPVIWDPERVRQVGHILCGSPAGFATRWPWLHVRASPSKTAPSRPAAAAAVSVQAPPPPSFPKGHSRCNPLRLERRLELGQRDDAVAVEVDRTDHLVKDLVAGVEAEAKQRCFELRRVDGAIAVLVEELEELRL